jgi:hypothetical protein
MEEVLLAGMPGFRRSPTAPTAGVSDLPELSVKVGLSAKVMDFPVVWELPEVMQDVPPSVMKEVQLTMVSYPLVSEVVSLDSIPI